MTSTVDRAYLFQEFLATGWKHLPVKNRSIEWARGIFQQKENWLIFDTETTGIDRAEICQICLIDLDGQVLLDTLLKPTRPIPPGATAIHGITDAMVANEKSFTDIYPALVDIFANKQGLAYNAQFDVRILNYSCQLHKLSLLEAVARTEDVMVPYSNYYGEPNPKKNSYKWQKLPSGDHSAKGDCLATLEVLKQMAKEEVLDTPGKAFEVWCSAHR